MRNTMELRKRAEEGDAESQFLLGYEILENGEKGTKQEGLSWYRLAAHQGNTRAMRNLGDCYQGGYHVKKNITEGYEWHLKAAMLGLIESRLNVGMCYAGGKGVSQDEVAAFMWLHIGIPEDEWFGKELYVDESTYDEVFLANSFKLKARKYKEKLFYELNHYKKGQAQLAWFRLGFDDGPLDCLLALGHCFQEDSGIKNHYEEAVKMYRLAAEHSWTYAEREAGLHEHFGEYQIAAWEALGRCYEEGIGVPKDKSLAEKAFEQAERIREEISGEYLD
jgi:TPR repeat protein